LDFGFQANVFCLISVNLSVFNPMCSIAEIIDRYKKEQIVEGHVLGTPVFRV
jgi:hypothetical protein